MKLFLLLISFLFVPSLGIAHSAICIDRFDPTLNDFAFKIKPASTDCKNNERLLEVRKERLGIWLFLPSKELKQESFDKFSSDPKE